MYGSIFRELQYTRSNPVERLRHFGLRRYCPVCRAFSAKFQPFGVPRRPDARCPVCGSLERHRLLWHYLTQTLLPSRTGTQTFLHFAPLPIFRDRFSRMRGVEYVTADIIDPDVHVHLSLPDMPARAAAFDIVLCSHVLEHIPDDAHAMREIWRVTAPGGVAVFMVPLNRETTLEGVHLSADERQRLYGNPYHVRDYGWDIVQRLEASGFAVTMLRPGDVLSAVQRLLYAPNERDYIFVAQKSEGYA